MKRLISFILIIFFIICPLTTFVNSQSVNQGIDLFEEALKIHHKAQSNTDKQRAVKKYEQALKIFEKNRFDKGIGVVALNLGTLFLGWGDYDKALSHFQQSLAIRRKLKDVEGEGQILNNMGAVYYSRGDYDRALVLYKQSLAIRQRLKDLQGEGQAMTNIATVYWSRGDYDRALVLYKQSLGISRKLKDLAGEGKNLGNMALIYKSLGDYDRALELQAQTLTIFRKLKDVAGEGRALNNIAIVHKSRGDYDRALELYEQSLAISNKLKNAALQGATLRGMAEICFLRLDYDRALELYEQSLGISRKLKDLAGEGKNLSGMARVYLGRRDYDRAFELYNQARAIFWNLKNVAAEGAILGGIGTIYAVQGKYDRALELYEQSLAIHRKLREMDGEGATLSNMANVYQSRGNYDRALELYEQSLAIDRKLKDLASEGQTLDNMAVVYRSRGNYDRAFKLYEQSLVIRKKVKDVAGQGEVLIGIGRIHQARRNFGKALEYYRKSLAIKERLGVPTAGVKDDIGNLFLDQGDIEKAESFIKEWNYSVSAGRLALMKSDYQGALEHYIRLHKSQINARNADILLIAYTGLGTTHERMGNLPEAADHYRMAVEHTEEMRRSISQADRATFFNVTIGGFSRSAPYEGLARTLTGMDKRQEAFKTSEFTKARGFAEATAKRSEDIGNDIPESILKQDEDLTNRLAALAKNLREVYAKDNKELIWILEPEVMEAKKDLEAHVAMLRSKHPLFAATRYPNPMDLDQTELQDDEWVISYDVTDPGLLIYLTKGKEIVKAVYEEVPRKEIDELVRKFREPLEIKSGDSVAKKLNEFDFESGKRLSDILLGDILSEIPENTNLIIIPDDSLGVLPFEMIVLNEGAKIEEVDGRPQVKGAEFFGDRNPISYYQSLTALTLARTFGKKDKGKSKRLLVMDDPVFDQKDPRVIKLAKAKREELLDSIVNEKLMSAKTEIGLTFPRLELTGELGEQLEEMNKQTDRFTGLKATKTQLIKNKLTKYGSMVFATHGYFGKDLPGVMEPVLVMTLVNQPEGQDGFLRMSEVMGLKLDAGVVALTACQSGLGRRISGEGTMGMGRAFQYAGAKSVLMSLWSVSEKASVQLVESFFKNLKDGKSKLEALQIARKEIREAGYDHPFYWAPFILVGEVD